MKKLYFVLAILFLSINIFPQDSTMKLIGPNVKYHSVTKTHPYKIKILEVDLTQPGIKLETVLAKDLLGNGFEKTSSMAKRNERPNHYVLGAVNGDYFGISNPEDPYGFTNSSMIDDYEVIAGKTVNRTSFGFYGDNKPIFDILSFTGSVTSKTNTSFNIKYVNKQRGSDQLILFNKYFGDTTRTNTYGTEVKLELISPVIVNDTMLFVVLEKESGIGNMHIDGKYVLSGNGTAQTYLNNNVNIGDTLKVVLTTTPNKGMIKGLLGGGPRLITNGVRPADFVNLEGFGTDHVNGLHPRTALGINQDSTKLFMIVEDGRQTISEGMGLATLADYMISIGCYQGVNLDGGGSSTMVIRGGVVNSPSDGAERSCANALLCVLDAPASSILDTFTLGPKNLVMDSTQSKKINITGLDLWGYPIEILATDVSWTIEGINGIVDSLGFFIPSQTGTGKVIGTFGSYADTITVTVMSELVPVWKFSQATNNLPTWFSGTDSNIRGLACGKVDGEDRLYIVVRPTPYIINPANGDKIGQLITTGVTGGASALNDIEVSSDGKIFGCNLTVAAGTSPFKIYKWDSETATPQVVLSFSGFGRLGDKFSVVGSWTEGTAEFWAAAGASNIVYKWKMNNGVIDTIPVTITLQGISTGGTSPAVYPRTLNGNTFFYNGNSVRPSEYNLAGQLIGTAPASVVDSRSNAMRYIESVDKKYLIVYQYGFPNENAAVLDITNGIANALQVELTPSLGTNSNTIGTSGDIAYRVYKNGLYIFYVLATNNGYGAYQLSGAPLAIGQENNFNATEYYLAQNYPNPFNPTTTINYYLPKESKVKLYVVNMLGEKVVNLYEGYQTTGNHTQQFSAKNLASGMYMYVLEASSSDGSDNTRQIKKMVLLK
ncbi:MAG: DUF4623 domain-containing protein [Syntrophothermus sp.]